MNWRVFEIALTDDSPHTFHIVGYAWHLQEGRVTSSIRALDLRRMIAKTESGRLYELCGGPGYRGAAEFVWREWLVATKSQVIGEVTQKLLDDVLRLPSLDSPTP